MTLMEAEHFVRDPHWTWYILFYFFFAGIAGGSYMIATLLRLRGTPSDEPVARIGFYVTFVVLLCCPPLLIIDLGQPLRFWHMMWNLTPGADAPNFKSISPMSVGVWGLLLFNAFAGISFVETLVKDGKLKIGVVTKLVGLLDGPLGKVVNILGCVFGLFIAGYTGVLLAVSNQPLWSDTWTLGGLFLASGLSSAASRPDAVVAATPRSRGERRLPAQRGVLLHASRDRHDRHLRAVPDRHRRAAPDLRVPVDPALAGHLRQPGARRRCAASDAAATMSTGRRAGPRAAEASRVAERTKTHAPSVAVPVLVLLGVLALRAAIIFPVHYYNWPGQ